MSTILITGASSGIGHALAAAWLEHGDRVFGVSRREPADLLGRDGFHFAALDLTEHERVGPVLVDLLRGERVLDLVVLNAGILGPIADQSETPLEAMRPTIEVNLWANKTVLDTLFASELRIRQIVGISSGAAVRAHRGWGAYCVSKAAFRMLLELYALEHPETHFCSLAPGLVDTSMQDTLCSIPEDPRFPSLDFLRQSRGTGDMPSPEQAAAKLLPLIADLPTRVESGGYWDVRGE